MSKYKFAVVVRMDLGMSTGKLCVQVGHASILAFRSQLCYQGEGPSPLYCISEVFREWLEEGQFKVALRMPTEGELKKQFSNYVPCPSEAYQGSSEEEANGTLASHIFDFLKGEATELRLPVVEVRDFAKGKDDKFKPNTLTAIGVGPALSEEVNKITGRLKLI